MVLRPDPHWLRAGDPVGPELEIIGCTAHDRFSLTPGARVSSSVDCGLGKGSRGVGVLHLQQPWAAGMVQVPCFHMFRYQLDPESWHLLPTPQPQHEQCLSLFRSLIFHLGISAV